MPKIKRVVSYLRRRLNGGKAVLTQADTARDERRWLDAAAAYRRYVTLEPTAFGAWVQLGHALKEGNDLSGADAAYARAFRLRPDNADLHLSLGHLASVRGDQAAALQHYRESFRLDGNAHASRELNGLSALGLSPPPQPSMVTTASGTSGGCIDGAVGPRIRGWAITPGPTPAVVEFVDPAGRVIGSVAADRERADLLAFGLPTSVAGFETVLTLSSPPEQTVTVRARLQATGQELQNSPIELSLDAVAGKVVNPPVTAARIAWVKPLATRPGGEAAIFLTHAPDGVVKPHILPYLRALAAGGVDCMLVVAADRPVLVSDPIVGICAGVLVRDNIGYDFGAWAHVLRLCPNLYGSAILYLVNDSMFGPRNSADLVAILDRIRASRDEAISLTETHEFAWHLQSYFLALKRPVLNSLTFQFFINDIRSLSGKQAVVMQYEIPLASNLNAAGFRTGALFASNEPRNPTMHGWRDLLLGGFPFVKTLLFRERFAEIDMTGWRDLLEESGFDIPLLEATLKHQGVTGPVRPAFALLAKMPARTQRRHAAMPLKVAFYGPWNYDNGLGSASRGLIGALRRTGYRLNLHPIKKPFHVHRQLAPANDIKAFEGPADIAIVHLNPDSWSLLTDEQRDAIRAAGKRVGYWVWEMSHLPAAWWQEFGSVDLIWAASAYNGALFAAQNMASVDIIPHPITTPVREKDGDPAALLKRLGLPPGRRIILYVFDGSSYLVRKNPAALIRAFAASRLGDAGWMVVLKTKHLYDRPAEGAALTELVNNTPDAHLINRSLPYADVLGLMETADIYASPHCAEGFGLSVAEAMALGKRVVATDFSGTKDFLDETCGYPVRADRYVLSQNFGHYTEGGEWARIDESALSIALRHAASDVERGIDARAVAARQRIGQRLSYEAVGSRIAASLEALNLVDMVPETAPAPALVVTRYPGIPVRAGRLSETIRVCPLQADGFRLAASADLSRIANDRDQWVVFAQEDAILSPSLAALLAQKSTERLDAAMFYGDDVALGEDTLASQLRYKPEFDLPLFVAQSYLGAPLIVRASALHSLGGLDEACGDAMLDDLVIRAVEAGMSIVRIPEVLLAYGGHRPQIAARDRQTILARSGVLADYRIKTGLTPDTLQLTRDFRSHPAVTLLIPTCRSVDATGRPHIERLLDSLSRTDWPLDRLRVLVGDDVAGAPTWACAYPVDRLETLRGADEPFNYAAKMNTLWRAASTAYVVFLNDDVVVTEGDWLHALMTFAVDERTGGVGPRLLYGDGSIQHVGIAGGLFGMVAHPWLNRQNSDGAYQDWPLVHREWSMLTGAVFATRRAILEEIGGFDEQFTLEYNDVDLCLRIRAIGRHLVYTPFATMTHLEKASRKDDPVPGAQTASFLGRWQQWLDNDPSFHPALRRDRFEVEPAVGLSPWFI